MLEVLERFSRDANKNPSVQRVVGQWNVDIVVAASGTDDAWVIEVRGGKVYSVAARAADGVAGGASADDRLPSIRLQGERDLLQSLFSGKVNPVRAASQGRLNVFGDTMDQTKLDAIALILWGP